MRVRDIFVAAQPFVIGIGVPLAVLVLPITYMQGRDIQKIADAVEDLKTDVSAVKAKIEALDARERQAEADPDKIVAKLLGISAADVSIGTVTFFDGKVVVLPKTAKDVKKLTDGGYMLTTISPTVQGYTAPMNVTFPKQ